MPLMASQTWPRELEVALAVVRETALAARAWQEEVAHGAFLKADQSPVTIADFVVQTVVAERLAEQFPDDPLVAEEDSLPLLGNNARPLRARTLAIARRLLPAIDEEQLLAAIDRGKGSPDVRFWTLDPIDGTQGFVRGGQFVVALALVERGTPRIGLLGCPRWPGPSFLGVPSDSGVVVFAASGRGAFAAPLAGAGGARPIHVSSAREPRRARILRSFDSRHIDANAFDRILAALNVNEPPMLMDSQAKHAVLASGEADLMIRTVARPGFHDTIWDQAAGALIIEEAGGRVTDLRGAGLDFSVGRTLSRNDGFVASNGHLHGAALDAIRAALSH